LKCPNCGGSLRFDPERQKSVCDYCLSEFTAEELAAAAQTQPSEQPSEQLAGYICDSCGAEVLTDASTTATFCYYCHNPVFLTSRLSGAFRPDLVIPFQSSREEAVESFRRWARSHRFVPPSFYSASQLEKMTGLYVPYWMAEYEADVHFQGQGIVRRVWVAGNLEYTEAKEYAIDRQGKIEVKHLHDLAQDRIDRDLLAAIAPFDADQAVNFDLSYLSGFLAEKYTLEREQVEPLLESRARDYAASLLQESIQGYSEVRTQQNQVDLTLKKWAYALFPTWVMTYHYQGKTYVYAVNGQTGKACGELPVSGRRLGLAAAAVAVLVLALALLGGWLIW
jgi:DNA-directed RNA polymerase subunit RPC12/RpoP